MADSKVILKNMFSLSVAEVASKGIAMLTAAYLARVLLKDCYGILDWSNSIVIYFTFLVNLGFDPIGMREIAGDKTNYKKHVNAILTMKSILAVILYSILFIVVIFINKPIEVKYVILIAGINIFSNAWLLNWFFMGIEKMEVMAIRQIITGSMNLLGIVIFVHHNADIIPAISVIVGSFLINALWMLVYYIKFYSPIRFDFDFVFWKKLLKSALPIAMTFFITIIYNYLSLQLLGFYRAFSEVATYGNAFKTVLVTMIQIVVIQNAFFPKLSRSDTIEQRDNVMEKFTLLIYFVGAIMSVGLFVYAEPAVTMFWGTKYTDSAPFLRLLIIAALFMYLNVSLTQPLVAWKKERSVFYAMLAGGIVSVALNFKLVPLIGPRGAAITSICTEAVVFLGLAIIFYRLMKKLYIAKLLILLSIAVAVCLPGYFAIHHGLSAILFGIISLVLYVSLVFAFKIITISEIKRLFAKR